MSILSNDIQISMPIQDHVVATYIHIAPKRHDLIKEVLGVPDIDELATKRRGYTVMCTPYTIKRIAHSKIYKLLEDLDATELTGPSLLSIFQMADIDVNGVSIRVRPSTHQKYVQFYFYQFRKSTFHEVFWVEFTGNIFDPIWNHIVGMWKHLPKNAGQFDADWGEPVYWTKPKRKIIDIP